jgi:hypothetical protein
MEFMAPVQALSAFDPEFSPEVLASLHARQRCARRGISERAIAWALEHGRVVHSTGVRFHFLGRQEIAEACACGADRRMVEKCQGLVVLVGGNGRVITVYRNSRALADIRRKQPYDRRRRSYPS